MGATLVVFDPHCPFDYPDYRPHCKRVYEKFGCDRTIFTGDITDQISWSHWEKEADAPSPTEEYKWAKERVHLWEESFPDGYIVVGNHDARMTKMASKVGLLPEFFRKFSDIWGIKSLKVVDEITLTIAGKQVLFTHGDGLSGMNAVVNALQKYNQNIVFGHVHSVAGIEYRLNKKELIFSMCGGCGMDSSTIAARYAKDNKWGQVLTCGVIDSHCVPYLIPMGRV
jgi:predicted phosphodiesterase